MKVGRNDSCACGSGKKFKKCCLDKVASPQGSLSLEEFNRKIAYQGSLGREKKKWCEDYTFWKTEQLKRISAEFSAFQESSGKQISCSEGCSSCCSQYIGASLQECEGIVHWLYQNEEVYEKFMHEFPRWRAGVGDIHKIGHLANAYFGDHDNDQAREAYLEESGEYGELNIPCPFLSDGKCSIYPVRPYVCASHVALSPPELCKSTSKEPPVVIVKGPLPGTEPPYFRGAKMFIMGAMPLTVQQILTGGYIFLNDLPGLQGMEAEAFADPGVKALSSQIRKS